MTKKVEKIVICTYEKYLKILEFNQIVLKLLLFFKYFCSIVSNSSFILIMVLSNLEYC